MRANKWVTGRSSSLTGGAYARGDRARPAWRRRRRDAGASRPRWEPPGLRRPVPAAPGGGLSGRLPLAGQRAGRPRRRAGRVAQGVRRPGRVRRPQRFRTWLVRIVSNAAIDLGRKRGRRKVFGIGSWASNGDASGEQGTPQREPAAEDDPARGMHREDLRRALDAALARLSPTSASRSSCSPRRASVIKRWPRPRMCRSEP